jgi:predicted anti-sigma-YlaC factor YlaD
MECNTFREAWSAEFDGEDQSLHPVAMAEHLGSCGACRQFVADTRRFGTDLTGAMPATPDFAARVLAASRRDRSTRSPEAMILRIALVAVALVQFAVAVPALFFGNDAGAPIHIAREVGAWDIALAVGFLFAAARPLRAVGLLPFVAALSAGLVITAVIDMLNGRAVALTETTHLLELVGAVMLWMLVAPRARQTRPELRVV